MSDGLQIIIPDERIVCGYLATEIEPFGEFPTTIHSGSGPSTVYKLKDGKTGRLEIWTRSADGRLRSTGRRIDVVSYLSEGRWPVGSFAMARWKPSVGDSSGEWQLIGTVRSTPPSLVGSGWECGCNTVSGIDVVAGVNCAKCNGSKNSRVYGIGVGSLNNANVGFSINPTPQASEFFVEYVSDCLWRSPPLVWSIPGDGLPATWEQVPCVWELDLDQSPPRLLLEVEGVGELRYEMNSPSFNCNGPTSFRRACSANLLALANIPCTVCVTPQARPCTNRILPDSLDLEFLNFGSTPLNGLTTTLLFGTSGDRLVYKSTLDVSGVTAQVEWQLCSEQLSLTFPCAAPDLNRDYSITTGTALAGVAVDPVVDMTFFCSVTPIWSFPCGPFDTACSASPWHNCGLVPGLYYYQWRARMTEPAP